jgi:predicted metal-binding membrane protein
MMSMESRKAFFGVSALLFAASAAVTIVWCASMSTMAGMPMPGGWTMSMAWMRMPGQTWPGAAASFLGMWVVMMVAMMMPSLVPMLWRYRQAVGRTGAVGAQGIAGEASVVGGPGAAGEPRVVIEPSVVREPFAAGGPGVAHVTSGMRLGWLTALAGAGYFAVWSAVGIAAFPLGIAVAGIEMRQPAVARAVPIMVGVVVLVAGALQFTAWKTRHLACCRVLPESRRALPADAGTAWRHGLRLGLHCAYCCAGLMAVLLVIGIMDLRAMAIVMAAITVERLAPGGGRVARVIGGVLVLAGLVLVARATGAG